MTFLKVIGVAVALIGMARTDATLTIDGTQLDITRETVDGVSVLHMEGTGMYQFTHQLGDDTRKYSLNHAWVHGDDFLIEGYTLHHATRTYDPFFVVIHKDGTLTVNALLESPLQQDLIGAYPLTDGYLLHMRESIENGHGDFQFAHDTLHILGEDESPLEFTEKITDIEAVDSGYLVYFEFQDTADILVRHSQEILQDGAFAGIASGATYTDQVTIHFAGEANLNGQLIKGPKTLVTPGKYTWTHGESVVNFTLDPAVSGIEANAIKSSDVRIDYTYGQGMLNGEYYAPGEVIEGPGDYVFGIYDANYAFEIPFKINARVDGVEHLKTYDGPVTITYQGEGYLNNEFLDSGSEVSDPGAHTLKVFGANGYLETIQFKIESADSMAMTDWLELSLMGGSIVLASWFVIREVWRFKKRSSTP